MRNPYIAYRNSPCQKARQTCGDYIKMGLDEWSIVDPATSRCLKIVEFCEYGEEPQMYMKKENTTRLNHYLLLQEDPAA